MLRKIVLIIAITQIISLSAHAMQRAMLWSRTYATENNRTVTIRITNPALIKSLEQRRPAPTIVQKKEYRPSITIISASKKQIMPPQARENSAPKSTTIQKQSYSPEPVHNEPTPNFIEDDLLLVYAGYQLGKYTTYSGDNCHDNGPDNDDEN